jgi:signal transduction histidine kinase
VFVDTQEQNQQTSRFKGIGIILFSSMILIAGLYGSSRMLFKPGMPFDVQQPGQNIIVINPVNSQNIEKGDVLLALGEFPLKVAQEIQCALDGKSSGQTVSVTIRRAQQELVLPIVLGHWYSITDIYVVVILGLSFWGIANWVVLKRPDDKPAQILFLLSLSLSFTLLVADGRLPAGQKPWSLFLPLSYYLIYPFVPAFFLHLAVIFPKEKLVLKPVILRSVLIYAPAFIFVMLLQMYNLRAFYNARPLDYQHFNLLFTIHRVYLVVYFGLGLVAFIHSYIKAQTKGDRDRIRWILWGIFVGCAPFVILWTMPQVLGRPPLVAEEWTYLAMILTPLSIAFAILKYHAFEIAVIINKSVVYFVLTSIIISLYLLLAGFLGEYLAQNNPNIGAHAAILCTLVAVLIFYPLEQKVQNFVDRTFYRVKYNYKLATRQLSDNLLLATSVRNVMDLLNEKIQQTLPITHMYFFYCADGALELISCYGMSESGKTDLSQQPLVEIKEFIAQNPLPLAKKGRITPQSAGSLPEFTFFEKLDVELYLPLGQKENRSGCVLLSGKLSGSRYSEDDLDLLTALSANASLALNRIELQEASIQERNKNERLEKLNQLKSDFISHVSHELRTPLSGICSSLQNLNDGIPEKPSPAVKEYLDSIYQSSCYLSRMIQNLLDVTKIEAQKLELFPSHVDVGATIRSILRTLEGLSREKKLSYNLEIPGQVLANVDPDAFQQIMFNLLENAIKFSRDGQSIEIQVHLTREAHSRKAQVVISVQDHGAGIPDDKLELIFEKYAQVPQKLQAKTSGLGLGLYITKKLIEAQSGKIHVVSQVGQGSVFSVSLPAMEIEVRDLQNV